METESHPTLEELANGGGQHNGNDAAPTTVYGIAMPAPAPVSAEKKKARRLVRTGSREGHPGLMIPGQGSAFVAPQRR